MTDQQLKIPEAEFERQSRHTAWIVTIVFHLCALLPLVFITCSPVGPQEELTQIVGWGGSGGNPDVNAPVGPAPKGNPNASGSSRNAEQNRTQTAATPAQPQREPDTKATEPARINESSASPTSPQSSSTSSASSESAQSSDNPGEAKGQPNGEGKTPAGGSGGSTVGVGTPGIGRCWSTSPSAAARGATTSEEGKVTIACIVKWDGTLTGIRKVSGSTTLFTKARQLLLRARACRAPPGTPDVPITLSYSFRLD